MDRLFGKELSNLLEPIHYAKHQQRLNHRLSSKSTRPDEPLKNIQKKLNRSSVAQNISLKSQKANDSIVEIKDVLKSKHSKEESK